MENNINFSLNTDVLVFLQFNIGHAIQAMLHITLLSSKTGWQSAL